MKEIEGASRPVGPTAAAQLLLSAASTCAFVVRTARILCYTMNNFTVQFICC